MATNYVQPGHTVTFTAPADVSSGDGVQIGQIFGVAQADALNGAEVELGLEGVYTLPKTSSQAWTEGALVYWTGSTCTTTAGSNLLIGCAAAAAANPSSTGTVRLNGMARADGA